MEFFEDLISIKNDERLSVKYSTDLISPNNLGTFFTKIDNIYINDEEISNFLVSLCTLELVQHQCVIFKSIFSSLIYDKPLVKESISHIFIKYGFHIHALNHKNGTREWYFKSNTPILNFHLNESSLYLVVISEDQVTVLDNKGTIRSSYFHNELILESLNLEEGICFIDFSGLEWKIDFTEDKELLIRKNS